MNNFCIALFLLIYFLKQAGIIVVSTTGEKLIVELKEWKEGEWKHFEQDFMVGPNCKQQNHQS